MRSGGTNNDDDDDNDDNNNINNIYECYECFILVLIRKKPVMIELAWSHIHAQPYCVKRWMNAELLV